MFHFEWLHVQRGDFGGILVHHVSDVEVVFEMVHGIC